MRVGTRLGLMTGGTVVVFAIVGITSYLSVAKLIESYAWVVHTKVTQEQLQNLLYNLADASSNQRGYLVTNQEDYLENYKAACKAVVTSADKLRDLTRDNPTQQQRIDELMPMVKERLSIFDDTIQLFQTKGAEAAFAHVKEGVGQAWFAKVREKISDMHDEEAALLEQRNADVDRSARITEMTIISGMLLAIIFVCFFNFFFARRVVICTKTLLRGADNIERGKLDSIHIVNADEEFMEVAGAFNYIVGLFRRKIDALDEEVKAFGNVNAKLREILCAISKESAKWQQQLQQALQYTGEACKINAESNVGLGRALSSIGQACQKTAKLPAANSQLAEKLTEMERLSLAAETLASELQIVGMSASIEAAKLGDSGAGFVAVADRINKLSGACQDSSVSIKHLLGAIQSLNGSQQMEMHSSMEALSSTQDDMLRLEAELANGKEALINLQRSVGELAALWTQHREDMVSAQNQSNAALIELMHRGQALMSNDVINQATTAEMAVLDAVLEKQ